MLNLKWGYNLEGVTVAGKSLRSRVRNRNLPPGAIKILGGI